jgi:hypothetical protein
MRCPRYQRLAARRVAWRRYCCAGFALWAGGVGAAYAQEAYTQSDFGGVGLLQTPSARMAQEGEFSFVLSRATPYTNYNVSLQPLPWLEAAFRYTNVSNRLYGPRALSGSQTYKDKSIDAKARLWEESRWIPTVSIGARDIGGTGLFSSEYVVANKRAGPFDFSLGLGWGYIGARGDIANPHAPRHRNWHGHLQHQQIPAWPARFLRRRRIPFTVAMAAAESRTRRQRL